MSDRPKYAPPIKKVHPNIQYVTKDIFGKYNYACKMLHIQNVNIDIFGEHNSTFHMFYVQ